MTRYGSIGWLRRSGGQCRGARELVRERLAVNPRDPALLLFLAQCDAALGDLAKGTTSLAQVIKLTPSDPQMLFDIAVIDEFRLHQRNEGLKGLAKGIENGQPLKRQQYKSIFCAATGARRSRRNPIWGRLARRSPCMQ
jgi:hypothetical protein